MCELDDIADEDVMRFDHDGKTSAVYRYQKKAVRQRQLVHARAGAPVCVNLKTCIAKADDAETWIEV